MFVKNRLSAFVAAIGLMGLMTAQPADAVTVDVLVSAEANSYNLDETGDGRRDGAGGTPGIFLDLNQDFSISVDPNDTWYFQDQRWGEVDVYGTQVYHRITTESTPIESDILDDLLPGTLIGQVGSGALFTVGTFYEGVADAAGELLLYFWDINYSDNDGTVLARVTYELPSNENFEFAVNPIPAPFLLLATGLVGLGLSRRRAQL